MGARVYHHAEFSVRGLHVTVGPRKTARNRAGLVGMLASCDVPLWWLCPRASVPSPRKERVCRRPMPPGPKPDRATPRRRAGRGGTISWALRVGGGVLPARVRLRAIRPARHAALLAGRGRDRDVRPPYPGAWLSEGARRRRRGLRHECADGLRDRCRQRRVHRQPLGAVLRGRGRGRALGSSRGSACEHGLGAPALRLAGLRRARARLARIRASIHTAHPALGHRARPTASASQLRSRCSCTCAKPATTPWWCSVSDGCSS